MWVCRYVYASSRPTANFSCWSFSLELKVPWLACLHAYLGSLPTQYITYHHLLYKKLNKLLHRLIYSTPHLNPKKCKPNRKARVHPFFTRIDVTNKRPKKRYQVICEWIYKIAYIWSGARKSQQNTHLFLLQVHSEQCATLLVTVLMFFTCGRPSPFTVQS